MSGTINKSAISVLDEFCKRKRQPPAVYTFNDSATDFVCSVQSFNETKIGKAKSKKKAKHAAAENLINHLRSLKSFEFDLVFLNVSPNTADETKVSSSSSKKVNTATAPEINYVGKLLEHCVKNKLPPASFDLIEDLKKEDNKIEFCMKCTVNDVEKQGLGMNKKQAKQKAAMEVLKVLQPLMTEPSSQNDSSKTDEPPTKRSKLNEQRNDAETSSTTCANIDVSVKTESKGKTKFDLFDLFGHTSSDSNDSNTSSDKMTDNDFGDDDDCEEIIDTVEVHSVQSTSDSDN